MIGTPQEQRIKVGMCLAELGYPEHLAECDPLTLRVTIKGYERETGIAVSAYVAWKALAIAYEGMVPCWNCYCADVGSAGCTHWPLSVEEMETPPPGDVGGKWHGPSGPWAMFDGFARATYHQAPKCGDCLKSEVDRIVRMRANA